MEYNIPDKLTFKRTEVTRLTRLDGKVIDYWEKEFGGIKPVVNKMGETFYSRRDVELILKIKQLMIVEKKDKSEIKKIIVGDGGNPDEKPVEKRSAGKKPDADKLKIIRSGLEEILTILEKNGK